jgi:hypothetical protein
MLIELSSHELDLIFELILLVLRCDVVRNDKEYLARINKLLDKIKSLEY